MPVTVSVVVESILVIVMAQEKHYCTCPFGAAGMYPDTTGGDEVKNRADGAENIVQCVSHRGKSKYN